MLKQIATAAVLLASTLGYAQKGTWLVETNSSFERNSYANDYGNVPVSLNDWHIALNGGYALTNNWTVGITCGYGQTDYLNGYSYTAGPLSGVYVEKMRASAFQAGVFGRYTYNLNKWLFVYAHAEVLKLSTDSRQVETYDNFTALPFSSYRSVAMGDGIYANLYPAVGLNVINGYGLNLSFGGLSYTRLTNSGATANSFQLNLGRQFNFGIHKFIGWKKANGMIKDPLAN